MIKLGLSWAKLSCKLGFGCTVNNICCCILGRVKNQFFCQINSPKLVMDVNI